MVLFYRLKLATVFLFFSIVGMPDTHVARIRCTDTPVDFVYKAPENLACLCETTSAAITFLKTLGLKTDNVLTIKIVDQFPSQQADNVVGYYRADSRDIYLLSYTTFKNRSSQEPSAPGSESIEETWCGYVAHELAHAISSEKILSATSNHLAGEYIAAVTQLAVLTPQSREKFLEEYRDIKPYKSISEMSALYYMMAPKAFAVKCYRHFVALDNPREFIEQLVNADNEFRDQY